VLQGGHIALRTALALEEPLAAVVGTSTWCEAIQEVRYTAVCSLRLSSCSRCVQSRAGGALQNEGAA
jgi:hypothetical protein